MTLVVRPLRVSIPERLKWTSPDETVPVGAPGCWPCPCSCREALGWRRPRRSAVRDHGARGDGRTKDTRAIQAAIDAAARSGRSVRIPAGDYLSGTLRLAQSDHPSIGSPG